MNARILGRLVLTAVLGKGALGLVAWGQPMRRDESREQRFEGQEQRERREREWRKTRRRRFRGRRKRRAPEWREHYRGFYR